MSVRKLRLMTWNVNGLRAVLQRKKQNLNDFLTALDCDVLCFQETKITRNEMDEELARPKGERDFFCFFLHHTSRV